MRLFRNQFLDKLTNQLPPHQQVKELRNFGTNLSIEDLSNLTGLSKSTIRRYEAEWNQAKIPKWYLILLRLLSGDLSYFGEPWQDAQIHYWNKKLTTPYAKYQELTPMDMNSQTNWIYKRIKSENENINNELEVLKIENMALKKDNEVLAVQNNRLRAQIEQKRIVSNEIKKNNVIEFKKNSI